MMRNCLDWNISFALLKGWTLYNFLTLIIVAGNNAHNEHIMLSHEAAIKHVDETFIVTCKDKTGRPVEWSGPQGPLGTKTHPRVEVASYGTSIFFHHVTPKHNGDYYCKCGEEQRRFHLTVLSPLKFMDTSPVQKGTEFQPVTLRCEVTGDDLKDDKPIMSWNMLSKDLQSQEPLTDARYQVIGDGLLISNVSRTDNNRTFICKALQRSTGDIREQKITLLVERQPRFKHPVFAKSEEAWGFIGGKVNLTCEVDAEPPPVFEWSWKKQIIKDKRVHNVSSHKSVLEIDIKDATSFGNYMCKVRNRIGQLDKFFVLQQGLQAPAPDFIVLRGSNADLIDIGIHGHKDQETMPKQHKPTGYRVEYKRTGQKDWDDKEFPINDDNSYPLEHLEHDTEYQVRAATRNIAGLSNYTSTSLFRTLSAQADNNGAGCSRSSGNMHMLIAYAIVGVLLPVARLSISFSPPSSSIAITL